MAVQFTTRNCPVCNSNGSTDVLQKSDLHLVQCRDCAMVYANPIEEGLVTGKFYDQLAAPFYLSPDKLESDYAPVRFERELKLFRRFCRAGRVLDVGCSTGAFLFQLQQRYGKDYEALGIDVAGAALDFASSKGVSVMKEYYLNADLEEKSFDAISFWAVLEHLADPRPFLVKTASLLKPGGHCFVLVPNFQSLAVRLLGARYRYILPQHVNYFTTATLARMVEKEPRLRVVCAGSSHFNPLVILQDWRRRGKAATDSERATLLKRTTVYKQSIALRPLKWALAGVEATLGRLTLADNLFMVLEKSEHRLEKDFPGITPGRK
jgi:2-polyprenyl-3-methyl-5-hydroxy-6-metoxy-1,4-benzoquinol methylase